MNIPTDQELLDGIDRFLKRHDMAATRFGSEATGEPQLLSSIRGGRSPSLKLLQRLKAYMDRKDAELAAADHVGPDTTGDGTASHGKSGEVSAQAVSA